MNFSHNHHELSVFFSGSVDFNVGIVRVRGEYLLSFPNYISQPVRAGGEYSPLLIASPSYQITRQKTLTAYNAGLGSSVYFIMVV